MTQNEKLIAKARNNPAGLRFSELCRLAEVLGWSVDRIRGSHVVFSKPGVLRPQILTRGDDGKAYAYQVRQLLEHLDGGHRHD